MRKIYKITTTALIFTLIGVFLCVDVGYTSNLRVPLLSKERSGDALKSVLNSPPELRILLVDPSPENFTQLLQEINTVQNRLLFERVDIRGLLSMAAKINLRFGEYYWETSLEKGDFTKFEVLIDCLNRKVFMPAGRLVIVGEGAIGDGGGVSWRSLYHAEILKGTWERQKYLGESFWTADIKWEKAPPTLHNFVFTLCGYEFTVPDAIQKENFVYYDRPAVDSLDGHFLNLFQEFGIDKKDFIDDFWIGLFRQTHIRVRQGKIFTSLFFGKPIDEMDIKYRAAGILRPFLFSKLLDSQEVLKVASSLGAIIAEMEISIKDNPDMAYMSFLNYFNNVHFDKVYIKIRSVSGKDVLGASLKKRGINSREGFLEFVQQNFSDSPDRANKALEFLKSIYAENFWSDERRAQLLANRNIVRPLKASRILEEVLEGDSGFLKRNLMLLQGDVASQRILLGDVIAEYERKKELTGEEITYMNWASLKVFWEEKLKDIFSLEGEDVAVHLNRISDLAFSLEELNRHSYGWFQKNFIITREDIKRLIFSQIYANYRLDSELQRLISLVFRTIRDNDEELYNLLVRGHGFVSQPYLYRVWFREIPESVIIGDFRMELESMLEVIEENERLEMLNLERFANDLSAFRKELGSERFKNDIAEEIKDAQKFGLKSFMKDLLGLKADDHGEYDRISQLLADCGVGIDEDTNLIIEPGMTFSFWRPVSDYFPYISKDLSELIRYQTGGTYELSPSDKLELRQVMRDKKMVVFTAQTILDNTVGFMETWERFAEPDIYISVQDDKEKLKIKKLKEIGLVPKDAIIVPFGDLGNIDDKEIILLGFEEFLIHDMPGHIKRTHFLPLKEDEILNWQHLFVMLTLRLKKEFSSPPKVIVTFGSNTERYLDLKGFEDISTPHVIYNQRVGNVISEELMYRYDYFRASLVSL